MSDYSNNPKNVSASLTALDSIRNGAGFEEGEELFYPEAVFDACEVLIPELPGYTYVYAEVGAIILDCGTGTMRVYLAINDEIFLVMANESMEIEQSFPITSPMEVVDFIKFTLLKESL